MPSRKPRVALTVPDDLDSLLDELADLHGTPKTKLIIELLTQMQPILETQRDALLSIKKGINPKDAFLVAMGSTLADLGELGEDILKAVNK